MNWKKISYGLGIAGLVLGLYVVKSRNSREQLITNNVYTAASKDDTQQDNFECENYYTVTDPNDPAIEEFSLDKRCIKYDGEKLEAKVNSIHLEKKVIQKAKPIQKIHKKVYSKPVNNQIDYSNDYQEDYIRSLIVNIIKEKNYGIEPELVLAIAKTESANFDVNAVGKAGEAGLMQLMPKTARKFRLKVPNYKNKCKAGSEEYCNFDPKIDERFDLIKSLTAGAGYLDYIKKHLIKNGIEPTPENIAISYNAGENRLTKYKQVQSSTKNYAKKVMYHYNN